MRMFLIRLGLTVGSVVLVSQWPFPVLPGLWVLLIWSLPRAIQDRQELHRLKALDGITLARISELEAELALAREFNGFLVDEVRQLQERGAPAGAAQSERTAGHPLFRKVGLDQDAPKWVIEVVRREYRRRLHPDGKPAEQKAEAERRFKAAEEVFSEIWKARGFQ